MHVYVYRDRYKQLTIMIVCLRVGTDWGDRARSRKDTFPVTFCAFFIFKASDCISYSNILKA